MASRNEIVCKIIQSAGLPPGKDNDNDNYFTKEQLAHLYMMIVELKTKNRELIEQVATLTERILTNDRSMGSSKSESF